MFLPYNRCDRSVGVGTRLQTDLLRTCVSSFSRDDKFSYSPKSLDRQWSPPRVTTRHFSGDKAAGVYTHSTDLNIVTRIRNSGAVPPKFPIYRHGVHGMDYLKVIHTVELQILKR